MYEDRTRLSLAMNEVFDKTLTDFNIPLEGVGYQSEQRPQHFYRMFLFLFGKSCGVLVCQPRTALKLAVDFIKCSVILKLLRTHWDSSILLKQYFSSKIMSSVWPSQLRA